MSYLAESFNFIVHIDDYLKIFTEQYGFLSYLILFFIIFCETGLVFFPFLPGDSLLFASGALAATGNLNFFFLLLLFISGAILGDAVNYNIGKSFGVVFIKKNLVKKKYLEKSYEFWEKHGGKAVIYARFVPVMRTLAPFVAGMNRMKGRDFFRYNIWSGILWVIFFLMAGYFFGNVDFIKQNFSVVILGIVFISVVPHFFIFLTKLIRKN